VPIYYVICEVLRLPYNQQYQILSIVKVIETTLERVNDLYVKEVAPMTYGSGKQIVVHIFTREPDNPFKEFKNA